MIDEIGHYFGNDFWTRQYIDANSIYDDVV